MRSNGSTLWHGGFVDFYLNSVHEFSFGWKNTISADFFKVKHNKLWICLWEMLGKTVDKY